MKKRMFSLAGAVVFALSSTTANAEFLAHGNLVGSALLSGSQPAWTNVYLSGGAASGGAGPIAFTTTASNQTVMVSHSGSCSLTNAYAGQFIYVRFVVDNSPTMTTSHYLFCAARGTALSVSDDIGHTTVAIGIPSAGAHTLMMQAKIADWSLNTTTGWGGLGNSSTVIFK